MKNYLICVDNGKKQNQKCSTLFLFVEKFELLKLGGKYEATNEPGDWKSSGVRIVTENGAFFYAPDRFITDHTGGTHCWKSLEYKRI